MFEISGLTYPYIVQVDSKNTTKKHMWTTIIQGYVTKIVQEKEYAFMTYMNIA